MNGGLMGTQMMESRTETRSSGLVTAVTIRSPKRTRQPKPLLSSLIFDLRPRIHSLLLLLPGHGDRTMNGSSLNEGESLSPEEEDRAKLVSLLADVGLTE